jgi:hypothetical protein
VPLLFPRRQFIQFAGLSSLLAGCSIQPLGPLRRYALPPGISLPALRAPALGQHWIYRVFNMYNSEQLDTVREDITTVEPVITIGRQSAQRGELPSEIHTAWGRVSQDPVWESVQTYDTPLPIWPPSLVLGASESVDTAYRPGTASYRQWIQVQSRVTGLEQVTVAAGVFNTLRIEKIIRLNHQDSSRMNYLRTDTLWLAPEIGRWVARETNGEYWMSGRRPIQYHEDHLRWELDSWT